MKVTIARLAVENLLDVVGDPHTEVQSVASVGSAAPGDLVLAEDEKFLAAAEKSNATAIVAGHFADGKSNSKPLLIGKNPRLAFARIARTLEGARELPAGVHPNAVVHSSAALGDGVGVGPNVVIGPLAVIGEGSRIGAGTHVHGGAVVGSHCRLGSNVVVHSQVTIGDRVVLQSGCIIGSDGFGYVRDPESGEYVKFPQIGRVEIHDDVEIGALCTVDRGALDATVIGQGTKLDNMVHVGHNVHIGRHVVIAAQTGISGSVIIEDHCVIGGQVGIGDHVVIQKGTVLGSQGGVLPHKVLRPGKEPYWGTPAQPLKKHLRELAALRRLSRDDK